MPRVAFSSAKVIEPIIEKGECILLLLHMLLVLDSLLLFKRLSIFFKRFGERIVGSIRIVELLWLRTQEIAVSWPPSGSMGGLDS